MAASSIQFILKHLDSIKSGIDETDAELYERVLRNEESAFSQLIHRHGPMVLSMCRNMLGHDMDSEDACQAVFLTLIRSAHRIRRRDSIAAWLHGVAFRICMKIRRTEARRRDQQTARQLTFKQRHESDWEETSVIVHEEIERLPDPQRLALISCVLQGRSQRDFSEQMGWKLGTTSSNISRARQQLLKALNKRGLTAIISAGLVTLNSTHASLPSQLFSQLLQIEKTTAALPAAILALTHGVVPMSLKMKLIITGVALAGLFGVGAVAISCAVGQQSLQPLNPAARHSDAIVKHPEAESDPQQKRELFVESGSIMLAHVEHVSPNIQGQIRTVRVTVGDDVKAGAILAEMDTTRSKLNFELAQSKSDLARARYRSIKAELTEGTGRSEKPLSSPGKERLEVAEAEIKMADAELHLSKYDLEALQIRAPIDGKVVAKHVHVGDRVNAQQSNDPRSSFFDIADIRRLEVVVIVPEDRANLVAQGQQCQIKLPGGSKEIFQGKVVRVTSLTDLTIRGIRAYVEIPATEKGDVLRPGMYVRVGFLAKD